MRSVLAVTVLLVSAQSAIGASIQVDKNFNIQGISPLAERILENELNFTLECVRYVLDNGIPEHNIPSLRTILIEQLNLDLGSWNLEGTSGHLNFKNFEITGLTQYVATDLRGSLVIIPPGLSFNGVLLIPNFRITTEYDMNMLASNIPVYGKGTISLEFTDVTFGIGVRLGILTGISFNDLSILPHIETSHGVITGWFHDEQHSEIISALVDELLPAWINQQPEDISAVISPIIQFVINDLIQNGDESSSGEGGEADESILDIILNNCPA